ncbi:hypothetical protein HAX54_006329 [Datura stramonium]|uniref:Uncharacterized protein n=1 Tax=Datura stramonium TaxID=4076 RepID=A0ABS8TBT1_DATST|nr:hypothetical protein [Datura stramonium]
MIRKKVFLTYKRKRLPGSDLYLENGIPNTPSECRKSKAVAPLLKEEEKYENPSFKDEKKHFEAFVASVLSMLISILISTSPNPAASAPSDLYFFLSLCPVVA